MPQNSVWSLLGMLAVVILILFLAYWATRAIGKMQTRGSFSPGRSGGREDKLCVLAQLNLGRNERLVLVRMRDRCCLLGVTPGQITLLRELDAAESADWLAEFSQPTTPGFAEVLKDNLRKRK